MGYEKEIEKMDISDIADSDRFIPVFKYFDWDPDVRCGEIGKYMGYRIIVVDGKLKKIVKIRKRR